VRHPAPAPGEQQLAQIRSHIAAARRHVRDAEIPQQALQEIASALTELARIAAAAGTVGSRPALEATFLDLEALTSEIARAAEEMRTELEARAQYSAAERVYSSRPGG
jgi:hypothetical protein